MAGHQNAPNRTRRRVAGGVIAVLVAVVGAIGVGLASRSADPSPSPIARDTPAATPSPTPRPTRSARPSPTASESPIPSPSPPPSPVARCPLDGMPLANDEEPAEPALAVQIENHPEARPARNLTRADMIVESTVEGDTTRFTGIYLCDETEGMTGPVRSARYYNIDLWQDLGVLTVGFGASPGALQRFAAAGMPYPNGLDGIWPWYQRYGSRPAPHNVYVDLEGFRDGLASNPGLGALATQVGPLRPPFAFDEDPEPPDGRGALTVEMWTNGYWTFSFRWDADLRAYRRSDAGVEIADEATGDPVAPTSVVVQHVTQETVFGDPDPGGNPRRLQHLVGSGEGVLYADGRAWDLRWDRPTAAGATRWSFVENGEPVVLKPGQVWLEILPVGSSLVED